MWIKYRWWVAGAGVVLIALVIYLVTSNLISYERQLARSEEQEKAAKIILEKQEEARKQFDDFRKESQRQMETMSQQQALLAQSMVARSQSFNSQVKDIKASTGLPEIMQQLKDYAGIIARPTENAGELAMPASQAQDVVILKIENEKNKADIADLKSQLSIEHDKVLNLSAMNERAMVQISQERELADRWKEVAESYKKAAKKSKLRKVLDVGYQVGVPIACAVITGQVIK